MRASARSLAVIVGLAVLAGPASAEGPKARVEQFTPQGVVKQVRQVTARFSESMVPLGDPRVPSPFSVTCAEKGSGRWIDSRSWSYDFERDLPAGVRCSFRLREDLRTIASNAVGSGFWSAVKTGTSKDMRDNWCVGYSRRHTVGVWVGNFSGEPMQDVTGISGAAPAWLELLSVLEDRGSEPPPVAGLVDAEVTFPGSVEPERREWFLSGTEPRAAEERKLVRRARILFPTAGSIIARDPDIPRERQRVVFAADGPLSGLLWRLDGRDLAAAARPFLWDPQPGRHELALVDGTRTTVDHVRFVVRPSNDHPLVAVAARGSRPVAPND